MVRRWSRIAPAALHMTLGWCNDAIAFRQQQKEMVVEELVGH